MTSIDDSDLEFTQEDMQLLNEKTASFLRASTNVYRRKSQAIDEVRKEIGIIKKCKFEKLETKSKNTVFRYIMTDLGNSSNIKELLFYPEAYEYEKNKWILSHCLIEFMKREGIKGLGTLLPISNTKVKRNSIKVYVIRKEFQNAIHDFLNHSNPDLCEYWKNWFFYAMGSKGNLTEKKRNILIPFPIIISQSSRSYEQTNDEQYQIPAKELFYNLFSNPQLVLEETQENNEYVSITPPKSQTNVELTASKNQANVDFVTVTGWCPECKKYVESRTIRNTPIYRTRCPICKHTLISKNPYEK